MSPELETMIDITPDVDLSTFAAACEAAAQLHHRDADARALTFRALAVLLTHPADPQAHGIVAGAVTAAPDAAHDVAVELRQPIGLLWWDALARACASEVVRASRESSATLSAAEAELARLDISLPDGWVEP